MGSYEAVGKFIGYCADAARVPYGTGANWGRYLFGITERGFVRAVERGVDQSERSR